MVENTPGYGTGELLYPVLEGVTATCLFLLAPLAVLVWPFVGGLVFQGASVRRRWGHTLLFAASLVVGWLVWRYDPGRLLEWLID